MKQIAINDDVYLKTKKIKLKDVASIEELEEVNKKTKRKVATAYVSSNVVISNNQRIPMNAIVSTTNKLTLVDNGIKIGSGISKVLVSASAWMEHSSTSQYYFWTSTMHNGTYTQQCLSNVGKTIYNCTHQTPHIVDVAEGDLISLHNIEGNGTLRTTGKTVHLTVEIIE